MTKVLHLTPIQAMSTRGLSYYNCATLIDIATGKMTWWQHDSSGSGTTPDFGYPVVHSDNYISVGHHPETTSPYGTASDRGLSVKWDGTSVLSAVDLSVTTLRGGMQLDTNISIYGTGSSGADTQTDVLMFDSSGTIKTVSSLAGASNYGYSIAGGYIYVATAGSSPLTWKRTDFAGASIESASLTRSSFAINAVGPVENRFSLQNQINCTFQHDGSQVYFLATISGGSKGVYCYPGAMAAYTVADQLWYAAVSNASLMTSNTADVFTVGRSGSSVEINSIDKTTGSINWTTTITETTSAGTLSIHADDDYVVVNTNASIRVYDTSSGTQQWSIGINESFGYSLDNGGIGSVVALMLGGKVAIISLSVLLLKEPDDGAVIWSSNAPAYRVSGTNLFPDELISHGVYKLRNLSAGGTTIAIGGARDPLICQRNPEWHVVVNQGVISDGYYLSTGTFDSTSAFLRLVVVSGGDTAHVFATFNTASSPGAENIPSSAIIEWAYVEMEFVTLPVATFTVTPGIEQTGAGSFPANSAAYLAKTFRDGSPINIGKDATKISVDITSIVQSQVTSTGMSAMLFRLVASSVMAQTDFSSRQDATSPTGHGWASLHIRYRLG